MAGSQEEENKALAASLKARLGGAVRPLTVKEIDSYGLESHQGVAMSWIEPKGPLGAAGLEVGVLVLKVNDQSISDIESFAAVVDALPHNQAATFKVLDHRSGETGNIEIVVR
ncbi:MAG: PDZ domain-containing protein [Methanoregulaceae archaeon]|nr:PDZ domain-containing protein [Methanoregulaceae archaeon]